MPCIEQARDPGGHRAPRENTHHIVQMSLHEFAHLQSSRREEGTSHGAVIDVGNSRFIIKSGDTRLIEELSQFCELLKGTPRAEVHFTNKLFHCTEQGKLQPWGWQRQSNGTR
jgi:hypothetical protein